jgi:hypothetical protein
LKHFVTVRDQVDAAMTKTREMAEFSGAAPARASEVWQALTKALFDPYRPELHYMRGPGPKWHEKHNPAGQPAAVSKLRAAH